MSEEMNPTAETPVDPFSMAEAYKTSQRNMHRAEELIYDLLDHCYPSENRVDIKLSVSHAESDSATQISLSCGGKPHNPFDQPEDGLGVTILKKMSRQLEYRREGELNQISIRL